MELHISIAAEKIAQIAGISITNSLLTTWIVMGFIFLFVYFSTKSLKIVPKGVQNLAELLVGGLYDLLKGMVGEKKLKDIFPLAASFFIFILISNWAGLIPGLSAIGLNEEAETEIVKEEIDKSTATESESVATLDAHGEPILIKEESKSSESAVVAVEEKETKHAKFIPLFRGPTADLNTTLALAIISVGSMIFFGIKYLGLSFFKRYLNIANPIMFFVGLLEFVSDISKILSFAFRLFGNIFAGEVLLSVIGYLVPVVATIPFLGLELFVGVIQALVFAMLSTVFIGMATTGHEEHTESHELAVEVVDKD